MTKSAFDLCMRQSWCKQWAKSLRQEHPLKIIEHMADKLGANSLAFACSFGFEDVALLDLVLKVNREIDVFYLDTGLLFPETYELIETLSARYNKSFIQVKPDLSLSDQSERYGDSLWERDPDLCCQLRKVEPLRKILKPYRGWITGIRREQSKTRRNTEVVEWDSTMGLVKINPLAFWKSKQVWAYIMKNKIPYNPLHDRNYPSIGCRPCTRPVRPGEDFRAGRWSGKNKVECGLHVPTGRDQ
jgi:phosphoadenosine phosphosulfate reductase